MKDSKLMENYSELFSRIKVSKHMAHLDVLDKDVQIRPYEHGYTKSDLEIIDKHKGKKNSGLEKELVFAQKNLVQGCLIGEVTGDFLSVDHLPIADYIKLMLELKRITTGDNQELRFRCVNEECKDSTQQRHIENITFRVEDCVLLNKENCDIKTVEIGNEGEKVILHVKPYTFSLLVDNISSFTSSLNQTALTGFYADFVETIEFPDKTYDNLPRSVLIEFLNKLNKKEFVKLQKYVDNQPKWKWEQKWQCPVCGAENIASIEEISDFFSIL